MRGAGIKGATQFQFELVAFGARHRGEGALLYVVEARDECEARQRLAVVANLFGVADCSSLEVLELPTAPAGVPTFLRCFFEKSELDTCGAMLFPAVATLQ